jgi:hypothetical protein
VRAADPSPLPNMSAQSGSALQTCAAGAVAGSAAVWAMDQVGWWLYRHEDAGAMRRELAARPDGLDSAHLSARKLGRLFGRDPGMRQPNRAGLAVHYALGTAPGALYALARRLYPLLRRDSGLSYGLTLFVVNDEIAAPAFGVARGPQHYPWQAHARGLVAHIVLGVVTDRLIPMLSPAPDGGHEPVPDDRVVPPKAVPRICR